MQFEVYASRALVARGLWVLTLPELARTRRVRAFMDHYVAAFAPHRAAMAGERGAEVE